MMIHSKKATNKKQLKTASPHAQGALQGKLLCGILRPTDPLALSRHTSPSCRQSPSGAKRRSALSRAARRASCLSITSSTTHRACCRLSSATRTQTAALHRCGRSPSPRTKSTRSPQRATTAWCKAGTSSLARTPTCSLTTLHPLPALPTTPHSPRCCSRAGRTSACSSTTSTAGMSCAR